MGNKQSRSHGHSTGQQVPRSQSDHTFQRVWSRTSRRRRSITSLTDPYLASRTTWPVPQSEAMFLPEYEVNPKSAEQEYKVLHQINKGAYGDVLKVQRQCDSKMFAMKVLSKLEVIRSDAIKQCKEEASIQGMVGHHPFIVQIHKTWQNKIHLHIVMDYATHGDLYTLWLVEGAFSESAARIYSAELAMVVDFLHNAGIVYRDLKMENILLDHDGHIKVTDFGLSKWLKKDNRTTTICGTLQYMAPEVLNEECYSHAVDWWSLGIVLFIMLVGKYPVDGAKNHHMMYGKVLDSDYQLPSHISENASEITLRLLCKDPMQRLQSLSELKKLSFFQDTNFEQLLRRGLKPKTFLKRKLPRTMPRKGCSRKTFFQDKIPRDLTVDNFDWIRVTAL